MILKTLLTALFFVFVFSQPVFAVESEDAKIAQNLLKFNALNACVGCDLSRVNLTKANLTGADLRYAYLGKANLTEADLTGAHLSGAFLREANLTGADLTGADLKEAILHRANLTDADLTETKLKNAEIKGAIFCNTKTPWGLDNSGCKK